MRMLSVTMGMCVRFVAPNLTLAYPCMTSVNWCIVQIALTHTHVTSDFCLVPPLGLCDVRSGGAWHRQQAAIEQSILDTRLSSFFSHCSQHTVQLAPVEGVLETHPGHKPDIEGGREGRALAYWHTVHRAHKKNILNPEKRYIQQRNISHSPSVAHPSLNAELSFLWNCSSATRAVRRAIRWCRAQATGSNRAVNFGHCWTELFLLALLIVQRADASREKIALGAWPRWQEGVAMPEAVYRYNETRHGGAEAPPPPRDEITGPP